MGWEQLGIQGPVRRRCHRYWVRREDTRQRQGQRTGFWGCKENWTWGWMEVGVQQGEKEKPLFPFSENNVPRTNRMEFQLELPVKYAVYVVVTRYWLLGPDLHLCLRPWAGYTHRVPVCVSLRMHVHGCMRVQCCVHVRP